MSESLARTGEAQLCFEVLGADADPTLLLVMGMGLDLLWWRDDFCALLVDRGLRVVRFDNRDVGRSTRFPGPTVSGWQFLRRRATPTYSLGDLADDAAGLLEHVAPGGAHVAGVSLGAFIAQELAVRHAARVRSLTSIMGRPGDGRSGRVAKRMLPEFLRPPGRDPVESLVRAFRRIGSTGRTTADDDDVRRLVPASARRAAPLGPEGADRQLAAILNERDRTPDLRALRVPALVVHGERDRVVLPSGGRATAAAIPGAELLMIEGMGHDLPRRVWPQLADALQHTVARGEAAWTGGRTRL